jgi:hypothetical protein
MSAPRMLLAIEIPLCWVLLCSPAIRIQMPPQPGKLVINSEPPGAAITINDKRTNQATNATFVVSPGSYTVSAQGGGGKVNCPTITLRVVSGQTVVRSCPGADWVSSP